MKVGGSIAFRKIQVATTESWTFDQYILLIKDPEHILVLKMFKSNPLETSANQKIKTYNSILKEVMQ